jgi:hypothetical protein
LGRKERVGSGRDPLASVRVRRDDLYDAILGLERPVGAPARGRVPTWAAAVRDRLRQLTAALRAHVDGTEEEGGLFDEVLEREPRLAHGVDRLRADHRDQLTMAEDAELRLSRLMDESGVEDVRVRLHELIHKLLVHRSTGAELVYDAYNVDLSAGD